MVTGTGIRGTPWWVTLIAGIALTILGLLTLAAPGITLLVLIQLLGLYWLVVSIVRMASIFIDRTDWVWKLIFGILGVIAGVIVVQHPAWSGVVGATFLVLYLAISGLVMGVIELVTAFRGAGWGTGLLGAVNVLFGVFLLFNPLIGVTVLPFLLGAFGLVGGIAVIVMAFRNRSAY
jgi:uncharacterized membrane protein HdeD (DUF308 family)